MNDALKAALDQTAGAMNDILERLLPLPEGPEARLFEAMRYASLDGGKRLRPFFVLQTAALFNVADQAALRVAAAIEMVHCYSLVHDDLPAMDDDDLRRGRPTVHRKYDEATAILVGDGLLAKAFEVLAGPATHSDPQVRCELVWELASASGGNGMVGGQMVDLLAAELDMDMCAVTRLQQMKTGRLIGFSCEAGAVMGKAAHQQRQALKAYAHDIGLAFQIADDLLDVEGDPALVGKGLHKDKDAGKATFVSLLGVERAHAQADALSAQAVAHLDVFGEKADLLREAARFVVERRQ
ncbi:MAG TPA: farnesyl diphosphate synthase [Candidatus Sulfotelmatobacter sp.]|jgi:farnesyl diphosphate synthase|nr:farnesyl diphosphate synthase [Candidatus Sulfotelmatobacter sp.]